MLGLAQLTKNGAEESDEYRQIIFTHGKKCALVM